MNSGKAGAAWHPRDTALGAFWRPFPWSYTIAGSSSMSASFFTTLAPVRSS